MTGYGVKSRPNGLASRRKLSTRVSFGHLLAWTFIDFKIIIMWHWIWSSSNSHASWPSFVTVWPPNASRHKLSASQLYMREIYGYWWLACTLRADWRIRLAAHRKSARKLAGFARLRRSCLRSLEFTLANFHRLFPLTISFYFRPTTDKVLHSSVLVVMPKPWRRLQPLLLKIRKVPSYSQLWPRPPWSRL